MATITHTDDAMGQMLDEIMGQVEVGDDGSVIPQEVEIRMGDDPVFPRMYSSTHSGSVVFVNLLRCNHAAKTMTFRVSTRGAF